MCVQPALNHIEWNSKCSDRKGFDLAILCFPQVSGIVYSVRTSRWQCEGQGFESPQLHN
jgi:hypothetical protein